MYIAPDVEPNPRSQERLLRSTYTSAESPARRIDSTRTTIAEESLGVNGRPPVAFITSRRKRASAFAPTPFDFTNQATARGFPCRSNFRTESRSATNGGVTAVSSSLLTGRSSWASNRLATREHIMPATHNPKWRKRCEAAIRGGIDWEARLSWQRLSEMRDLICRTSSGIKYDRVCWARHAGSKELVVIVFQVHGIPRQEPVIRREKLCK